MTKEEYAELWYLLGKLRYSLAEFVLNNKDIGIRFENFNKEIEAIKNIPDFVILENEKKD